MMVLLREVIGLKFLCLFSAHCIQVLKRNQQRAAGSVIILVSQGTVSNVDLEASLDLLRQEEVTLAAIEYPSLGKLLDYSSS